MNAKDEVHGGTPLGWALYGWNNPAPEFRNSRYRDVVSILVRSGAIVDWDSIDSPDRGSSLGERVRADAGMMAALKSH